MTKRKLFLKLSAIAMMAVMMLMALTACFDSNKPVTPPKPTDDVSGGQDLGRF